MNRGRAIFNRRLTSTKSMTLSTEPRKDSPSSTPGISTNRESLDVSVVIPALNEQENLELLLPLIHDAIRQLNLKSEVIVVDGGSQDDSKAVAERLGEIRGSSK